MSRETNALDGLADQIDQLVYDAAREYVTDDNVEQWRARILRAVNLALADCITVKGS